MKPLGLVLLNFPRSQVRAPTINQSVTRKVVHPGADGQDKLAKAQVYAARVQEGPQSVVAAQR